MLRILLGIWISLCCFLISPFCSAYEVLFQGVEEEKLLDLIRSTSQLEKLKEAPPETALGLRRRAEEDIFNITQALHSQAYYGAKAHFSMENHRSLVVIHIDQGSIYPFASFKISYLQNGKEMNEDIFSCPPTLEDLKVCLGEAALPETIINAEDLLLDLLNLQGYAFASIKKREVFADQQAHHILVHLQVELGPLTYFGPTQIKGLESTEEGFIRDKLCWKEGEVYDPKKIEKTQEALELTGLLRSVRITHAEEMIQGDSLPMEISVLESKQRSIGFGLNYMTTLGPAVTAEWENRNMLGEGQKLSIRGNIFAKLQQGSLSYTIPDFERKDQNLIWLLDYRHDRIKAFIETAISFSGMVERKISEHLRLSYGGMYKVLRSERSAHNGTFDLIKAPIQLRWSNVDSILDPTRGVTLQFKTEPSLQIFHPQFAYAINTFTGTFYHSLTNNKRHILATKLMVGSILGASKHEIPPPERFLAGSETTLRGYRYLTVSPLGRDHKVLGGRSLFVYSIELRNRIGKNFGWTIFYDIGNVYKESVPTFKEGVLQSIGLGLRYYTPIGPLRLDVAFPLNKRSIDHSVEVYFNIGQSF